MTEVVGLVIGGVGLATLFDSCMNAFQYVESASKYGKDYQKAALKISVLQLRLTRWGQNVKFVEDASGARYSVPVATAEEVETVKSLLGNIEYDFEAAEKLSQRHQTNTAQPGPADGKELATVESLTRKVKSLAIHRQKSSSLGQKTRWALQDKRKLDNLIGDLNQYITDLVNLFPGIKHDQLELAKKEASELVQPSEIEEPAEGVASAVELLQGATSQVDEMLEVAVNQKVLSIRTGHDYADMEALGATRVEVGDYVAEGQKVNGHMHKYRRTKADGTARVRYGNNYGGKGVFDGKSVFDD